jgi:hypothetical protein
VPCCGREEGRAKGHFPCGGTVLRDHEHSFAWEWGGGIDNDVAKRRGRGCKRGLAVSNPKHTLAASGRLFLESHGPTRLGLRLE